MEMQWKAVPCSYLRCAVREVQNQEQTLELRLTEGMPDIGRVLCAWGQPQLREKQWRSEEISISGGVNAWVLYIPEDGSYPRCVEGWIPFQAKWRLPPDTYEGYIRAEVGLRGMDARAISSRKMIVRASLALVGEALVQQESAVSQPEEIPDDIYLLRQTYPVQLAREAGEKLFSVEDGLNLAQEQPLKLLCCRLGCQVTEQAVTGSRIVLRGVLDVSYLYVGQDERIHSGIQQLPFAQYADLEGDYDKEATCAITMSFAGMECVLEGDSLQIKCDMVAQYVIHDRCLLQVTEDAYSPHREAVPVVAQLEIPVLLDQLREKMDACMEIPLEAQSVVDTVLLPDHPVHYREGDHLEVELPGLFQLLYYDAEGNLQSTTVNWAGHWQMRACESCNVRISLEQTAHPSVMMLGDKLRLEGEVSLDVQTGTWQQIPMVTGLVVGEHGQPDPNRPSVILRRPGSLNLWQLAKSCGSTVEAIEKANGLTGEPDPDNMLLIPVI